jgi:hypothetical protein
MSVTFASGIIPTSVSIRLVISISRFSVTTKYLRHQVTIFQPCQATSTPHRIQMTPTSPPLAELVTKTATSRPAGIRIIGPIIAIGCIRTVVTIRSLGMRYLSTTRGGRVET